MYQLKANKMSSVNSVESKQSSPCELFTWKNPIQTGKVFGVILAILLVIKFVNLFKIFFHVAYLGLLSKLSLNYMNKKIECTNKSSCGRIRVCHQSCYRPRYCK